MATNTLGDVLAGLGFAAGGLSEGIETGVALTQRSQEMELRKRQANLQSISALGEVLKPGIDPAIREFTLNQIMPQLGMDPDSTKKMLTLANKMDDDSRAVFTEFINNNPDVAMGKTPPKVLLDQLIANPIEGFKFMNDWVQDSKAAKRAEAADKRDETRLELDTLRTTEGIKQDRARTSIAQQGLQLEADRNALAAKQAEAAILDKMIDNRRQAMTALTNAANIKNPKARGIVAQRISDEFGLDFTPEDIQAFETDADSIKTLLDKAKLEKTQLEIGNLESGVTLPKSQQKAFLDIRARGETTESMPKSIKEMTPEQAAAASKGISKVEIVKGDLENKGSRDKVRIDVMDLEVAQNLNSRLIKIIQENPEVAGLLGTSARLGQKFSGALTSFEPIVSGAREEIAQLVATADPATKTTVAKILANREVSVAEVLETAIRLRYARTLSDSARINKDQYDVAADQVQITGLIGQEQVLNKLQAVQDVLETFRQGKKKLLEDDGVRIPTMSPEDVQDDEEYNGFLNEIDPDDEDEEE